MTITESHLITAYDYFVADKPMKTAGFVLPRTVSYKGTDLLFVGDDDGNGKKKVVVLAPDHRAVALELPASYKEAEDIRMGTRLTTYQVGDGPEFWIGEDAIRNGGKALPIGETAQRLSDPRHRDFGVACVVEALRMAGYAPGTYPLMLVRAIPNEEVEPKRVTTEEGTTIESIQVKKETRKTLKAHLQGFSATVTRTSPSGEREAWTISYPVVLPQPQSIGTFVALTRDFYGVNQMDDVEAMRVNDTGGGDDQLIEIIHDRGNWRMIARRLGNGTIDIARALKARFPELDMNDAQAQHALEQRSIRNSSGRRVLIEDEIRSAVQNEGQAMLVRKLDLLKEKGYFLVFTGGGVRLPELRTMIEERAHIAGKVEGRDYVFVDSKVAGTLNAFGVMLAAIFSTAGRSF